MSYNSKKTGPRDRPLPPAAGASRRTGAKVDAPADKRELSAVAGGAGTGHSKSKEPQGSSSSNTRPASASRTKSSRAAGRGARPTDGQDTRPSVVGIVAPRPRHHAICLLPSPALLAKLGSIIAHADECVGPGGHIFDLHAVRQLAQDEEVQAWLAGMRALAMLPVKR